ncbi:hypothetical protein CRENBAI_005034 [Crenichthys baileyi]|uniref:Uncharacterized protein n=1 Tax=Crenichthys baileyi TaxID=28760 RepID=A0AAV9S289_9TELE
MENLSLSSYSPTPSEPQHEPCHRATPNRDTDIEHTSPNPNATNTPPPSPPHRGTPPQVNSVAERPMRSHPPLQPRSEHPHRTPLPHHTVRRNSKARAPRNTTPTHWRNRVDPAEHHPSHMTASRAAHHQARPVPPDSASSPSPPVHKRDTYTSRVPGPCRPTAPSQAQPTSRPGAVTRRAPPPHPPDRQLQPGAPTMGRNHRSSRRKATAGTVSEAPRPKPHPQTPGVPQPPDHPHPAWRTTATTVVQRPAPPSERGHINSMPAKSPLPEPGTPPSRQTRAQSQGPRSKGTQAIPRERAETPATAPDSPQDLTPKPSPEPTRGPTPSPGLRPQMGNSEQGCEKTPSLPPPAQMWC